MIAPQFGHSSSSCSSSKPHSGQRAVLVPPEATHLCGGYKTIGAHEWIKDEHGKAYAASPWSPRSRPSSSVASEAWIPPARSITLRITYGTAKLKAATRRAASACTRNKLVPPYKSPVWEFTHGAANAPVATTPIVPPIPWHAH